MGVHAQLHNYELGITPHCCQQSSFSESHILNLFLLNITHHHFPGTQFQIHHGMHCREMGNCLSFLPNTKCRSHRRHQVLICVLYLTPAVLVLMVLFVMLTFPNIEETPPWPYEHKITLPSDTKKIHKVLTQQ